VRVALAGSEGQLGRSLHALLGERVVFAAGRGGLDVRDGEAVARAIAGARPDVVINASAYNRVDAAESDVVAALGVNAAGPRHLATAAKVAGALFVHVSTDYVFDGTSERPYTEDDTPRPLNVYGVSKLAGEQLVLASGVSCLVVRTSGVFGADGSRGKGGSFIDRILAQARDGKLLRVVDDQTFSPTYAPDLAGALLALIGTGARGLFHVTNGGACSWRDLALAALAASGLDVPVEPVRATDLGLAARRPAYSVLSNARYSSLGLPALRPWGDALRALLK
jgi:dTDP-4-dehydrorhamnose reductase